MDSIQTTGGTVFDSSSIYFYLGIILLLVALFFIRKYLYRFDEFLNRKNKNSTAFIEKPWHISWSLFLGIIMFLSGLISRGNWESFSLLQTNTFIDDIHVWHWFWLMLIIAEVIMVVVVIIKSITHFGKFYGIIRSVVIVLLMSLYFLAGLYMGLIFVSIIAVYLIYRFYKLFYGRKKGLLTS